VTKAISDCKRAAEELQGFLQEWENISPEQARDKVLAVTSAKQMFQRLRSIDDESKEAEDPKERTRYAKKFPRETCMAIVRESLKRAKVKTGRITDENRQKFLQALGTLRRKAAKRVVYRLSPTALQTFSTAERQAES